MKIQHDNLMCTLCGSPLDPSGKSFSYECIRASGELCFACGRLVWFNPRQQALCGCPACAKKVFQGYVDPVMDDDFH